MTLDILGHLAYVLIAVGLILLAKRNILGWMARFIGEFIWLLIGIEMGMSSIWAWGIVFMTIDAISAYRWYYYPIKIT